MEKFHSWFFQRSQWLFHDVYTWYNKQPRSGRVKQQGIRALVDDKMRRKKKKILGDG